MREAERRALPPGVLVVSQEQQEQARARVEENTAALEQAKVAVDAARLNLQRAEVRAPTDGTVTNLDIRVGGYGSFRFESNDIDAGPSFGTNPPVQRSARGFDFRRFVMTVDASPSPRLR